MRYLRCGLTLRPFASLQPLTLPDASLEVWCYGANILARCNHGGAHFVAVCIDCSRSH